MRVIRNAAWADSSQRKIDTWWRRWTEFAQAIRVPRDRFVPEHALCFLVDAFATRKPTTFGSVDWAFRLALHLHDVMHTTTWPTVMRARVSQLKKGLGRLYGSGVTKARPIMRSHVQAAAAALDSDILADRQTLVMMAMASVAQLRVSEVVSLRWSAVRFDPDGPVDLKLIGSKSSQYRYEGFERVVCYPSGDPLFDVQERLRQYRVAMQSSGHATGLDDRVFPDIRAQRARPMTPERANQQLRRALAAARIPDADSYSWHGLRCGGFMEAAARGLPLELAVIQGRWSSDAWRSYFRATPEILTSMWRRAVGDAQW